MALDFLKRLFSSGGGAGGVDESIDAVEHKGYRIKPLPMKEASGWRVNGEISKEIGGETRTCRLVRADVNADQSATVEMIIAKARRVIEEQGDRMFD